MGWFTNDAQVIFPDNECLDFEKITVSSSAVGLTASKLLSSDNRKAIAIALTVETDNIRLKLNGADPTSTDRILLAPGTGPFIIQGNLNLVRLRMIRQTSDATAQVSYYYGPRLP